MWFKWFRWKRKQINRGVGKHTLPSQSIELGDNIKKLNNLYSKFDESYWKEFKSLLLATDMGNEMALRTLTETRKVVKKNHAGKLAVKNVMKQVIIDQYNFKPDQAKLNYYYNRLNIFLIVGVNGVGKTTSIAKITNFYLQKGQKILLVAADTFRAGAVQQLQIWADKLNVDIVVPGRPNQDPASLVHEGVNKALQGKYDLVLIDTAGRLHNKVNLMNELAKIRKVIEKLHSTPQECLLVIDALVGQTGLNQAEIFLQTTNVTGIVLTKTDSTAKGGIILKIKQQLNLPVKLLGLGEDIEDLKIFDIDDYVTGILGL